MKKLLLLLTVLAAVPAMAEIGIGIRIGPPPAPRVVRVAPPPPAAGYVWIDGYWYADGRRWRWHDGYWTLPPYGGAHWVAPRHDGQMFFEGYWEGDRGRFEHSHRWDRDHDRDRDRFDRDRDRDHDRDRDRR